MPDDAYSAGSIDIRPQVQAEGTVTNDASSRNAQETTSVNEFAPQDAAMGGVTNGGSFAPVSVSVSPVIRSSGGVTAALNNPALLAGMGVAALVGLALLYRRNRYGYY